MENVLFIQKLKNEKIKEYIDNHKEVKSELLKALIDAGFKQQIVWINGNILYLYFLAENFKEAFNNLLKSRAYKEWREKMILLMDEVQDYSEVSRIKKLEIVFDLERQLNEKK